MISRDVLTIVQVSVLVLLMLGILEVRVHAESATRVLTLPHGTVTVAVHPASDIQRAFALPKYPNTAFGAWLGSDVATSVPVPNASRVLWLWGDTLLGNLYQDAHAQWRRNVTAMPRNSLAAQVVLPGGHIASPLYWSIRYNVSEAEHSGVFAPRNQSRWYWPTSGAALDGHTLVLLAYDTYSTKPHVRYHAHVEEEAARPLRRKRDLDFNFERSVLLVVRAELAASDPLSWRAHTLAMPHTGPLLQWCTALVVETSHVYLFGATPNATVLARLPLAALLATPPQLSSLEYWTTAQKWAPELRDTGELAPVFGPGVRISETSVTWSETLKCYYALNIRYMQCAPRLPSDSSASIV